MGRINHVGTGYCFVPKGYVLQLADDSECRLVVFRGKPGKRELMGDAEQQAIIAAQNEGEEGGERVFGTVQIPNVGAHQWHNLKLRFKSFTIVGLVNDEPVLSATHTLYAQGMVRLMAGREEHKISTSCFDNLLISGLDGAATGASVALLERSPSYAITDSNSNEFPWPVS